MAKPPPPPPQICMCGHPSGVHEVAGCRLCNYTCKTFVKRD